MRLFINKFVNKSINFKKLYGKNKKSMLKCFSNYERNKMKDRVYVNGESVSFSGVGIEKKNNRVYNYY